MLEIKFNDIKKCMAVGKFPLIIKLKSHEKKIVQVVRITSLGTRITSYQRALKDDVNRRIQKRQRYMER